jgi:hypothetical protein
MGNKKKINWEDIGLGIAIAVLIGIMIYLFITGGAWE